LDRIRIVGGNPLNGTIAISGAKNAALPLMIASLLTEETLTLDNVPRLADVAMLKRILGNHGVDCMVHGKRAGQNGLSGETLDLTAGAIVDTTAPYEMVSRMRASFWVIGPLIARMGEARVSLPTLTSTAVTWWRARQEASSATGSSFPGSPSAPPTSP
jgi:UDP-N-acetylglucosamine 1-carboxyvinyltransferase